MSMQHPNEKPTEIRSGDSARSVPEESSSETANQDERSERSLAKQLQALAGERDAAKDQFLRAQAELENYRKRIQREREEERRYAALPLLRDLLPGMDNLQRALDAARHTDDLAAMLQGVEMVAAQFEEIMQRHGAEPIPAVGERFDPNLHAALQQMPSADHPPMTIIDEIERGYMLHNRVLRPSKVIVSVALPNEAASET
jgi:molecular chaperone GrpE